MKCKIRKFIDSNYGEEVEYILIREENENIIIFEDSNTIHIIRFRNERSLIEKLIETKIENNFFNNMLDEQENDIEILKKLLRQEG